VQPLKYYPISVKILSNLVDSTEQDLSPVVRIFVNKITLAPGALRYCTKK